MNKSYLEKELANLGPALRTNRQRVSNLVLETPELLPFLIEIVFEIKNKTSLKAAWVLELVCADKLDWLAPHLDYFIENIGIIEHDSAVRPISKICNFLAISYNSKKKSVIKIKLTFIFFLKAFQFSEKYKTFYLQIRHGFYFFLVLSFVILTINYYRY